MHTPSPDGGLHLANIADTSSSSSSPSTRVTPNCRKAADTIASEPARCPVCDWTHDRPTSVRPGLIMTTGTRRLAAWSSASMSVRPSLNPSMYPAIATREEVPDLGLPGPTFRADLREPGREDERERSLFVDGRLQRVLDRRHQ